LAHNTRVTLRPQLAPTMGCSQSSQAADGPPPSPLRATIDRGSIAIRSLLGMTPLQLSGELEGACALHDSKQRRMQIEYGALSRGIAGKDQDRFYAVANGSAGLVCGICDGHSVHSQSSGQLHAEAAARHLATEVWKRVAPLLEADLPGRPDDVDAAIQTRKAAPDADGAAPAAPAALLPTDAAVPGAPVKHAATKAFLDYQKKCEAKYQETVADKVITMKEKLEAEIGEELPLQLPQEGGTTATCLLIHPNGLLAAWVGDSRALLAVETADGSLVAVPLTSDHNAHDADERARLISSGGKTGLDTMASHVFVPEAEGGLKVTRSLGDSPFHKDDAVSAVPMLRHCRLTPKTKYAIVASDGIWDHLTDQKVAELVAAAVRAYAIDDGGFFTGAAHAAGAPSSAKVDAKEADTTTAERPAAGSTAASTLGSNKTLVSSGGSSRSGSPTKRKGGGTALAACKAVLDYIESIENLPGAAHKDDRSIAVVVFSSIE